MHCVFNLLLYIGIIIGGGKQCLGRSQVAKFHNCI